MKAFSIKGSFMDIRNDQVFSIEVAAEDADAAREYTLSTLGSRHKLERRKITIDSITELQPSEITNHTVKYQVTGE